MARVTHVKKAQQRYETVAVLDDDGNPKQTPVMKNGVQKKTKRGALVFMKVTVADKTKPLPPYTCDSCQLPIEIGKPYKHITPKSGPYGGRKRTRHEDCPTWQVWEYSNSLSAQLAQISHDFWSSVDSAEDTDDVQSALDDASAAIKEIAEAKREGASNIEEGFGHPTSASEELEETAESLDQWADDVEQATIPDLPEIEEVECEDCGGTGRADQDEIEDAEGNEIEAVDCETCEGTGQVTPEELPEEQLDEWRDEVRNDLTIVDESPV